MDEIVEAAKPEQVVSHKHYKLLDIKTQTECGSKIRINSYTFGIAARRVILPKKTP